MEQTLDPVDPEIVRPPPPTARNAERAQFLATQSTCPPLVSPAATLHRRSRPGTFGGFSRLTTPALSMGVFARENDKYGPYHDGEVEQTLQLLMYQRSSSTRRRILSSVSVSPRAPETCAQPVIPDLTWWRKAYFSIVEVK